MKKIRMRTLFKLMLVATTIGTACVTAVGLFYHSQADRLQLRSMKTELESRLRGIDEKWIANLLLNQPESVKAEAEILFPEMKINEVRILDRATPCPSNSLSNHVVICSEEPTVRGIPYMLAIDLIPKATHHHELTEKMNLIPTLILGTFFLILSLMISLVYFRRLTFVKATLDHAIASPTEIPKKSLYFGDDEFGPILAKAYELRDRAREAERAQALMKIAKSVSHDIRSPLSAMNVVLASPGAFDAARIGILKECAKRITNIANELLDSARLQFGLAHGQATQIGPILAEAIREKQMAGLREDGVIIEFISQVPDGVAIGIDAGKMDRILSNLLNNAIEASPAGSQVRVRSCVESSRVIIEIRNRGPTIPAKILSQLGKRPVTHGKGNGNGLGLYSAREALSAVGASLTIQSTDEEGTCVRMFLPVLG